MNAQIPYYLIESFLMAANEQNFQLAADKLKITQSTLSKQMIQFEDLLPHKVFAFDGRKKILTTYGHALFDALNPKFNQTQELIEHTNLLFSNPENIEVRICGRGELLEMLAINLKFNGRILFIPMDNENALDAVLHRKAEIALLHTGIDSTEIVMKPFLLNSFKIAVSKSLLKSKPNTESALIQKVIALPFLQYKEHDTVIESVLKSWNMNLKDLHIYRTYPNYTTLARMAHQGQGWVILPSHTKINESANHVFPISIGSLLNRKFHLCYRKDISKVPWLQNLVTEIKNCATSM